MREVATVVVKLRVWLGCGLLCLSSLISLQAASITISGNVFTDEGATSINGNKNVAVSIQGAAAAANIDTGASGNYELDITVNANDVLTLYLDDETEDAVTITNTNGTASLMDVDLYQNYLILRSDNGTGLSNDDLDVADGNSDADITGMYTMSSNTFGLATGKEFLIPDKHTFSPAGNVSIGSGTPSSTNWKTDVDGELNLTGGHAYSNYGQLDLSGNFLGGSSELTQPGEFIQTGGNLSLSTAWLLWGGTTSVGTDVTISGGNLIHNNGNVVFHGRNMNFALTATNYEFEHVDVNKPANFDVIITSGNLVVNGNLTLKEGEVLGGFIEARGNVISGVNFDGSSTTNANQVSLEGTNEQTMTINGAVTTGIKMTKNSSANVVFTASDSEIDGPFDMSVGGFTAPTGVLTIGGGSGGGYNITYAGGNFTVGDNVLIKGRHQNYDVNPAIAWRDVEVFKTANFDLIITNGNLISSENLILTDGDLSTGVIQALGNVRQDSTFDGTSFSAIGFVSLEGSGEQIYTVNGGGMPGIRMNNNPDAMLVFSDNSDYTLEGDLEMGMGNFHSTSGVLHWGGESASGGADVTISGGNFIHNYGTVRFQHRNTTYTATGNVEFYDVHVDQGSASRILTIASGNLIATGNLTLTDGRVNTGILEAKGNVFVEADYDNGTASLHFTNGNVQIFDSSQDIDLLEHDVVIEKSGGEVLLASNLTLDDSQDLTIREGVFSTNSQNLTFTSSGTFGIEAGGNLHLVGDETTVTEPGSMADSSIVEYVGNSGPYTIKAWNYLNLRLNGESGLFQLGATESVSGNLTVSAGNLDLNDQTFSVNDQTLIDGGNLDTGTGSVTFGQSSANVFTMSAGNLMVESDDTDNDITIHAGTWTVTGGGTTFRGSSSTNVMSIMANYFDLTLDKSGATFTPSDNLDINGAFTLTAGTLDLNANNPNLNIAGDVTLSATITPGIGTVTLDGDLSYNDTTGSASFGNVEIGASPDTTTLTSDMVAGNLVINANDRLITDGYEIDVGGNITINGNLEAQSGTDGITTINLGGSWANNSGNFTSSLSDVIFDGSGTGTILNGTGNFHSITINGTGDWSLSDNLICEDLNIPAGTFRAGDNDLTVNGEECTSTASTTVYFGSGNWHIHGDLTLRHGSTHSDSALITLYGSSTNNFETQANRVEDVIFESGASYVGGFGIVAGNVTVKSGATINVGGSAVNMTIQNNATVTPTRNWTIYGGNLINNGHFQSASVYYQVANSGISGSGNFFGDVRFHYPTNVNAYVTILSDLTFHEDFTHGHQWPRTMTIDNSGGYTLTLKGNVIESTPHPSGGSTVWTPGSGNVTLSGVDAQSVDLFQITSLDNLFIDNATSSVTFTNGFGVEDLFCTTPGANLIFASDNTFTVNGNLELAGVSGNFVRVSASDSSTRFTFDVPSGNQETNFIKVSGSNASSNDIISGNSFNLGNNDNYESSPFWVFPNAGNVFVWSGNVNALWEEEGNWDINDGSSGNDGYPDDTSDRALLNSTTDAIVANFEFEIGEFITSSGFGGNISLMANVLANNDQTQSGNIEIGAGNLIQNTGTLNFVKLVISNNAAYENHSTGQLTVGTNGVVNDGDMDISGSGAACGGTDLLIRSSSTGVQRAWSGSGNFNFSDVDVQDQGGSSTIRCYHSKNTGNNGSNWKFHSECSGDIRSRVNSFGFPMTF